MKTTRNRPPCLKKIYKGSFDFRIGATSYVYPDGYLPNIRRLGPHVDEIELLIFESQPPERLPDRPCVVEMAAMMRDLGLTYNIHLPLDLELGAVEGRVRQRAVDTIRYLVELVQPLSPSTYTLHLDGITPDAPREEVTAWQGRTRESLMRLIDHGIPGRSLSVETLGYPFNWVAGLIEELNLSVCLDLGHLLLQQADLESTFQNWRPRTVMIHLHGVRDGRDHLSLDQMERRYLTPVWKILACYRGVVSLEVFNFDALAGSLRFLEQVRWAFSGPT